MPYIYTEVEINDIVSVSISTKDIIDNMDDDDVKMLAEQVFNIDDDYATMADQYWHGNFDLKSLFRAIGPEIIRKDLDTLE